MEKWRKDREDRRRQEQLYEKEYLSVAHTVAPGKDLKHITNNTNPFFIPYHFSAEFNLFGGCFLPSMIHCYV